MTFNGGTNNLGNIFRVKPDGTGFSNLFDFDGNNGLNPQGSLISDGTFLYGMTGANGSGFYPNTDGTIFKIMPDGSGFTTLHNFPFTDENVTNGNLTYDGTFLYGMSTRGGANSTGSIFRIDPNGTGYVELMDFDGANGSTPVASLLLQGTSLFGMTPRGGENDLGTVFKVSLIPGSINITQQPANVAICLGQTATLVTTATGVLGLSYKWQRFNGTTFVDIDDQEADEESGDDGYEGTDSPILKFTPIHFPSATDFRCRIFSPLASQVFTASATVSVVSGFIARPMALANSGCGPGQFLITAFGSADGNYRWYNSAGALISGQVNSTFTTPFISSPTSFSVTNKVGSCESDPVTIEVNTMDCALSPGLVWAAQPTITSGSDIQIGEMEIDASGNIYAVGNFTGTVDFDSGPGTFIVSTAVATERENFVLKLASNREVVWVKSLNNSNYSLLPKISLDGTGNIYITGGFKGSVDFDPGAGIFTMTSTGNVDMFITKLDTDGSFVWAKSFGGTGTNTIFVRSVASDGNGVYTTGNFSGTVDFDPNTGTQLRSSAGSTFFSDIFISKLDLNGNFSWAYRLGRTSATDAGRAIEVDASGNVYSTGTFSGTVDFDPGAGAANLTGGGATDLYIHKLNNDGAFQWAKTIGGTGVEIPYGLALDAGGNPHILGTFGTVITNQTVDFDPGAGTFNLVSNQGIIFVLKLTAAGNFTWAKNFGQNYGAEPSDITVDVSGNVLVVGSSLGIPSYAPDFDPGPAIYPLWSTRNNAFVSQFNSSGDFSWAYKIISNGVASQNAFSIVTDPNGSIYTSGSFESVADLDPGHCIYPLFSSDGGSFIQKVKPGVNALCFNLHPIAAVNCNGTSTTFSVEATGTTNITYQWQKLNTATSIFEDITNTGGYSGTTTPNLVVNTSGNFGAGTYHCRATGDNAPDKNSNAAALSLNISAPIVTDSESCSPGSQTLTGSGAVDGNYRWYDVPTGGTPIAGETNSTYTTPSLTNTTTYYVSINNGTCESTRISVTATINSAPSAPTTTAASNCGSGNVTLTANGGTNGEYRWYDAATGGTAFTGEVNSTYTTPALSATTNYYVAINNGTCESARTLVVAQIINLPPAPAATGASSCGSATLTLNASGGTDGQYRWYTVATAGSPITGEVNSSFATPSISSTTTYYVSINDGTCESTRTSVIAQIDAPPVAPLTTNNSSCGPAALIVSASGATNGQYRWYTTATGGTAIPGEVNSSYTTPTITTTTTYYVSNSNGTCESTRTSVIAQINAVPAAPTAISASGCPSTPVTLSASGATNGQYRWYTTATGGTAIAGEVNSTYATPALVATTTYYVSINDGICESARTSVLANVISCATNLPPAIQPTSLTTEINGLVTLSLLSLISDPDNNIDLTKLKIISQPLSGAIATIDANQNLTIDYNNVAFSGTDELTIEVCDLAGSCVQQKITIKVDGDIVIYNGISANGDQLNSIFEIKNIDLLESTKNNRVSIFNRWGSKVFETENYNNTTRVFTGLNKDGNELPSGTYFYKIEFSSGREQQTGYITLKR